MELQWQVKSRPSSTSAYHGISWVGRGSTGITEPNSSQIKAGHRIQFRLSIPVMFVFEWKAKWSDLDLLLIPALLSGLVLQQSISLLATSVRINPPLWCFSLIYPKENTRNSVQLPRAFPRQPIYTHTCQNSESCNLTNSDKYSDAPCWNTSLKDSF